MSEILENIETPIEVEIPQRVNPFCVISKTVSLVTDINGKKHAMRDIQTNSGWSGNPYKDYAVVPDNMVQDILATGGFVDIVLSADGTEVVEFTAREIPDIPKGQTEPSQLDLIEAQATYTALMTDTLL